MDEKLSYQLKTNTERILRIETDMLCDGMIGDITFIEKEDEDNNSENSN